MWHDGLFEALEALKDEARAAYMAAYMKDQFVFLGVATPQRRKCTETFFKLAKEERRPDYDFVKTCYRSPYREHQYVAVNYLEAVKHLLKAKDIDLLEELITSKSWWDTVDGLDRVAGDLALKYPKLNQRLLIWSQADNIWLRRAAIDHQLFRKDRTDLVLLETIIVNNLGQKEFFINKAIGWSLRELSKSNPAWVASFIERHREGLSKLSVREASKYLTADGKNGR